MRIDFINRPTPILSTAMAVLIVAIALDFLYPARPADAHVASADTTTADVPDFGGSEFMAPRLEDFGDMLDRPLFFSNRKLPEPPEVNAAPVAAPTPLELRLEGVAITGESRVAVLRDLRGNQLVQLAEGTTHDGWTLESVTADSARFRRGQQVTELALDPDSGRRR